MIGVFIRYVLMRLKIRTQTAPPATGAVLFLGNHTTFSDPMVMALAASRPVHFMASEQLFRNEKSGKWVRRLHAFPKAKYARDKEAIGKVVEHNQAGRALGLFPEGNRSWDGRSLPVRPGLGWLIKKIEGPIIFVRNETGWMLHPRWARYPRWVPMKVEISEPVTYPADWTTAQIEADVTEKIAIDSASVELDGFCWGYKLAHGLPMYLWACPTCFAMDTLRVDPADDDGIDCPGCGSAWKLDVRGHLTTVRADAKAQTIAQAYDVITEHFGELPTVDADRFVDTGIALDDSRLEVSSVVDGELTAIVAGSATLSSASLKVGDWELPLKSMKAVSIELGNVLQVRTADELLQLDTNSPLKWRHFLAAHHAASSPRRRGRRR
ncbi:MAG: 1-acyl-sn-glycerol-3-phosphate acyltransferase [Proteobacteria bacterium]|nr:1-acyl-sn-glycerol-3-phosphate acyltransferase [Pseudomonadota bacterium]MCP4916195.1 1-acyl-sn-glycerol-3-phosphate acyltransferase [Pseudomonadota bacterium]